MKKNLRIDEAASILNCSKREIYRLAAAGELCCFLVGKSKGLRIVSESLEAFIARRIQEFEHANDGSFCD